EESRQYLLLVNAREQAPDIYGLEGQESAPAESFAKWFSEPVTGRVLGAFELHDLTGPIEIQQPTSDVPVAEPTTILERHRCWLRSTGSAVTESLLLVRSRAFAELPLTLPYPASVFETRVDGQL